MATSEVPTTGRSARGTGERGVSELVGFVLSFSIIVLSVGVLYTAGVGSLADLQGAQQTQNAEQVFLAVADGLSELQEGQAPKRAGSLDLDVGATLSVSNATTVTVRVNGPGYERTVVTRTLEYTYDRSTIAYESGAVFRDDRGASTMLGTPPELYCSADSNVAVISLVTLVAPGDPSISGGTVTITGVQRSTTLLYPESRDAASIENVTITVDSPYEAAWNRHLGDDSTDWEDPDDDGTFACEDATQAFVRHTVVELRIVH